MATYETLVYERVEEKIFRLTLNRPEKLNAFTFRMIAEIREAIRDSLKSRKVAETEGAVAPSQLTRLCPADDRSGKSGELEGCSCGTVAGRELPPESSNRL